MPKPPIKKGTRLILEGLGLLVGLAVLMIWLAGGFRYKVEPSAVTPGPAAGTVNTQTVEERSYPVLLQQVGTTRMETESQVSSRIIAQVLEILVHEGDAVTGPDGQGSPGTVMVRLDDRDVQAKLRQASAQAQASARAIEAAKARAGAAEAALDSSKARLTQSQADYARTARLQEQGAATVQQVEHAGTERDVAALQVRSSELDIEAANGDLERFKAEREQADAAVSQARVTLSYTVIEAPFTGRVVRKLVEVGDTVNPGQGLLLLETPARPQFHANVTEALLRFVHPGQKLEVNIDTLSRTIEGTVVEVIPTVDPATRTVLVKLSLPPESGVVSGLFGRVSVPCGEYSTLVLPAACVRSVGQLDLVDVVDGSGHVHRRFVTLGDTHGELVEVLTGVKAGERVVRP